MRWGARSLTERVTMGDIQGVVAWPAARALAHGPNVLGARSLTEAGNASVMDGTPESHSASRSFF
jgi:hypothetical protein